MKKVTKKAATKKTGDKKVTPEEVIAQRADLDKNYKKMFFMVDGNSLHELSRKTDKKPAMLKAYIPDDLAEKLMNVIMKKKGVTKALIKGFRLEWFELK